MAGQPSPIRIAISGGGMAGALLMHALLKYPHLDVHIFEAAASFKEPGIAIGVLRNAKTALELIGESALECLERAGAVPEMAFRWMLGRGPDKDRQICEIRAEDGGVLNSIVQRASFIRELLAAVPGERMHASKKLIGYDVNGPIGGDGQVLLRFADGTTHECDVLIGADGIRSRVRQLLLGEADPAAHPVAAGWWFLQALKPYAEAQAVLGQDLLDAKHHNEVGYCGRDVFWMHNVLSNGEQVQLAICAKCDHDGSTDEWRKEVGLEELTRLFSTFPPTISKAVEQLIGDKDPVSAFYMWHHAHARTYAAGPVCITGDAAHSTTPWQASGAGMSIEDSLVLSQLLGKARSPAEAELALQVYDEVRRPRTQRIVDSSCRTGALFTGTCTDFDVNDLAKMREEMEHRWDFIMYLDMQKHLDHALTLMDDRRRE